MSEVAINVAAVYAWFQKGRASYAIQPVHVVSAQHAPATAMAQKTSVKQQLHRIRQKQ